MSQELMNQAIDLATRWQEQASSNTSEFEESFHSKMQKMLNNPVDKVFLIDLMDQCFRSHDVSRVENQIEYLFSKYGMATFFTDKERFLIFLFRHAGTFLPQVSIPLFIDNIRKDTRKVVLPGDDKALNKHLQTRRGENVRVNVNLIGEIVLGEQEAQDRMEKYLKALENPNIDYLSIKISTILSRINSLAFDETVQELGHRLKIIFKQAKRYTFKNKNGEQEHKFVNLDMEEYRDLSLTIESFKLALSCDELKDYRAGIVLQAYLPDSHICQKELTAWATERVNNGGAPIKVRIVKGANMEMEKTESYLRNWSLAPYSDKIDTDSNYKLMLEYGLKPENACAVNIGAASHNIFDLAYAFTLAGANGSEAYFSLEMLEGMGDDSRLAIKQISGKDVILYAPIAQKEQFTNAIAYLVRRLDENTSEDNFMRYSFGLKVGSINWEKLKLDFIESFENKKDLFVGSKRVQNRLDEHWEEYKGGSYYTDRFINEADTDFILPQNKKWAQFIRDKWSDVKAENKLVVPAVFAGRDHLEGRAKVECVDKSRFKESVICGEYTQANADDLKEAVQVAAEDVDGWRNKTLKERHQVLSKVANNFRARRGDLIGVAAAEVGKVFTETDVEVSEAIDFLEFYPYSASKLISSEHLKVSPKGVGLVVSPWNFPIAIPVGGVAAALAAGNTVILKPASNAVMCAYELCKCFWDAGVSKNTLQFLPCSGSVAGENLVKNPKVDFVILTGGESTAYRMLKDRPGLYLSAETGGKDATIVTAMADREQAIKNVVQSAFSNCGQKCSATSLLILENEVYFDESFKEALADAAKSLLVGSVWDFENNLGPMAGPITGDLKQAIETLDEGESWLLKPEIDPDNPFMLTPGVRWGVKEGNFCHKTELFGPILSVMRADDLKHAIDIVHQTGYGLTSGIESLDERETNYWRENLKAGNLYINRGTTGAIVLRQAFGGLEKSAVGSGRKAGGFNYVMQFMDIKEEGDPMSDQPRSHEVQRLVKSWLESSKFKLLREDIEKLKVAVQSYLRSYSGQFSHEHDFFKLRGEDNIFRYLKLNHIGIRMSQKDTLFDVLARVFAAKISQVNFSLSIHPDVNSEASKFIYAYAAKIIGKDDYIMKQADDDFIKGFESFDRVFYSSVQVVPDLVNKAASDLALHIITAPALKSGRLELLHYFEEQSISHSYHRYGNLGERALD